MDHEAPKSPEREKVSSLNTAPTSDLQFGNWLLVLVCRERTWEKGSLRRQGFGRRREFKSCRPGLTFITF